MIQNALELIQAGEGFDLILCDLRMPVMTGIEFYELLLSRDPALAARMIFMTGGAFTARAEAFLERSTNERLDKPFKLGQLESAILRVTSARPTR